ncbi:MAG TPA: cell division protein ZipA C-terminal FtsZ-binding domain-containing protein [Casimicrobiaceae bacterium]
MNPLFLGLLAAGIALVIGVLVYNLLQERRARRRVEGALAARPGAAVERAEPTLRGGNAEPDVGQSVAIDHGSDEALAEIEADATAFTPPQPLAARGAGDVPAPDPDIECVVLLTPGSPVPSAALTGVLSVPLGKPVRWLGRRDPTLPWQPLDRAAGPWQQIAACLLLADRSGAARRFDIEGFLNVVGQAASELPAECALPDAGEEAARAEELDRFCADLDVQIGLTILKNERGQIAGTRLRGVAEAAGFRLAAGGQFEYLQEETAAVLCSLQNYTQEPFTVESLRALTTPGVVLLIDVPRVVDPVRVFDQVRLVAKRLAKTLEGVLVDDNRRPLDDAALAAIRGQVHATAAALQEAHIDPGGPRALRLFG